MTVTINSILYKTILLFFFIFYFCYSYFFVVTPELISEASHNHHNANHHNHNHSHDSNSLSASVVIGYTALHYCVFFANSDGVKILLENGANANIKDESDGLIPIFTSLQKELSTLHDLTLRPDFCHKMRTITSLLISHTDMSLTDKEGDTVLHLLANNNVLFELTDKNQEGNFFKNNVKTLHQN